MAPKFPAQVFPSRMERLTDGERLHRLAALSTELYGDSAHTGLMLDMRVGHRTVSRWRSGQTPVPKVVLVALGAMVLAKRSGVPADPMGCVAPVFLPAEKVNFDG